MNEFGIALLWCTIQVTVVTLAAAMIDVACRRRSRPSGSVIVLTGLMLVIGLSLFAFSPWPNWSEVSERFAADNAPAATIETTPAPTSDTSNEVASVPPTEAEPTIAEAPDDAAVAAAFWNTLVAEIQHPKSTVDRSTWRWPAILASLFLAGLVVGVVRLIWGLLGVGAYRRRSAVIAEPQLRELVDVLSAELGCRRSIELRESTEIITAATVG